MTQDRLRDLLDPRPAVSSERLSELAGWGELMAGDDRLQALPLRERFGRIRQILEAGLFRVWPDEAEARRMGGVLYHAAHESIGSLLGSDAPYDVPTVVSAWHALRLTNPKAGRPMYQTGYDRFFRFFRQVLDVTPVDTEEGRLLSEVRDGYMQLLSDSLGSRSDGEYRSESYYWLTVMAGGRCSSVWFLDALALDAERRVFESHRLLTFYHTVPGAFIPAIEAVWLVDAFIGMMLCPRRRFACEADCIRIAKADLPHLMDSDDTEGLYTQLLALLHLRTGEDRYRQLADAVIATWPNQNLPLQQQYFRTYYQTATHRTAPAMQSA